MLPVIFYHSDLYNIENNISDTARYGASFLKAIPEVDSYMVFAERKEHAEHFAGKLAADDRKGKLVHITNETLNLIAENGCLFAPIPNLAYYASKRTCLGADSYSICCVSNMNPFSNSLDAIVDFISKPVYPWDALICTSQAIMKVIQFVLQAEADRMQKRLGIQKVLLPQTPVIPAGVNMDDFVVGDKAGAREQLGLDEKDIVLLSMGRFSVHDRANPLPMFQAAQKASEKSGRSIAIVMCGKFTNDKVKSAFRDLGFKECPDVKIMIIDEMTGENMMLARSCADIFCDMPDSFSGALSNYVLEAMAVGLPVVVSDFGALKEMVDENVGFKVPVSMPEMPQGGDIAYKFSSGIDSYDMFCGLTSSLVAVDSSFAADSIIKLIQSEKLRRDMGEAARKRVEDVYDWKVVMPQYEKLWASLSEIRKENKGKVKEYNSAKIDPFKIFEGFAENSIKDDAELKLAYEPDKVYEKLKEYRTSDATRLADAVLPNDDEMFTMICDMRGENFRVEDSIKNIEDSRKAFALRSIYWMLKVGLVKYR